MNTEVRNFSRHPFNRDQVLALRARGYEPAVEAEKPFFRDLEDLVAKISGQVAAAVIPGDLLRDAWANCVDDKRGPVGPRFRQDTVLIGWTTDEAARKRGRFAVRGIVIHGFKTVESEFESNCYHRVMSATVPVEIYREEITPTVENDFSTGEEFPYGEEIDPLDEAIALIGRYNNFKYPPFNPMVVGDALGCIANLRASYVAAQNSFDERAKLAEKFNQPVPNPPTALPIAVVEIPSDPGPMEVGIKALEQVGYKIEVNCFGYNSREIVVIKDDEVISREEIGL